MPMVAGPGGLAVVLSVSSKTELQLMDYVAVSAAIAACCFIVWICFREAKWAAKLLGETGMTAITKIIGFDFYID